MIELANEPMHTAGILQIDLSATAAFGSWNCDTNKELMVCLYPANIILPLYITFSCFVGSICATTVATPEDNIYPIHLPFTLAKELFTFVSVP